MTPRNSVRYAVTHKMSHLGGCWSLPWLFKSLSAARKYAKPAQDENHHLTDHDRTD